VKIGAGKPVIDRELEPSYQLNFMQPGLNSPQYNISIAVLVPCYNEELTVSAVVREFHDELPVAQIYVFDNNSTDKTLERAREAGAIVCTEKRQGKGYVVRSMFREVEADIFVLVDGDGTYPPHRVHDLIAPIVNSSADMTVGSRLHSESQSNFRRINRFGNRIFRKVLNVIFKSELTDILSGYRAFTRKFVKETPIFAGGFEIEAELTIKALERGSRIVEVPIDLSGRPVGSRSKIRVAHDGLLIFSTILALFRDYKPLTFFGAIGLLLIAASLLPGGLVVFEFLTTGLVPRIPSAILAVGLAISGMLSITTGLILHTTVRRFQELEHQLRSLSAKVMSTPE
jgi:glycosyltransferase involved in cell wall biosynthesis